MSSYHYRKCHYDRFILTQAEWRIYASNGLTIIDSDNGAKPLAETNAGML